MIKINHFFNGEQRENTAIIVALTQDTKGAHAVIAKKEAEKNAERNDKRKVHITH